MTGFLVQGIVAPDEEHDPEGDAELSWEAPHHTVNLMKPMAALDSSYAHLLLRTAYQYGTLSKVLYCAVGEHDYWRDFLAKDRLSAGIYELEIVELEGVRSLECFIVDKQDSEKLGFTPAWKGHQPPDSGRVDL